MHCEVHRVNEYSAKWKNERGLFSPLTVSLSHFDVASLFVFFFRLFVTNLRFNFGFLIVSPMRHSDTLRITTTTSKNKTMNRNHVELSHSFMCQLKTYRAISFSSLAFASLSNRFVNFCTFINERKPYRFDNLVSNCVRSLFTMNSKSLNLGGTRAWARAPWHIVCLNYTYETTHKISPKQENDRQMQLTVQFGPVRCVSAHFRSHLHYLTPINTLKGDKIEYT